MLRAWFLLSAVLPACFAATGEEVYQARCASCHDSADSRAPTRAAISKLTAGRIRRTLDSGVMMQLAAALSADERASVAAYVGAPGDDRPVPPSAYCADRAVNLTGAAFTWNGWSPDPANTRYQPSDAAGLPLNQVRNLKLKWAFGYDGDVISFSQPTVIGKNVFVGSSSGRVHALDLATGCIRWMFQAGGPVRSAIVAVPEGNGHTLLFGDQVGSYYALDAATGRIRWKKKIDEHESARVTGASAVYQLAGMGVAYIPVSSWEETRARPAGYACCTFRGSVLALRIGDGSQVWKTYTIRETPHQIGTQWGPSGASVWAAPTLDTKRGLLYATTGDNFSDPATDMSDAVVAMDLKTGRIVWSRQTTPDDVFNGRCQARNECPGLDYDFGSSAILTKQDGRDLLLAGQKSGVVYALDPDRQGAVLWRTRVGQGGVNGGVQWGMATDGRFVYAATSDVVRVPGSYDPKAGGGLTAMRVGDGSKAWFAPPSVCPGNSDAKKGCSPAQSSAVTLIPGVVFSGALDGHLRAFASEDGKVLWDFDTVRDFETVNGVPAKGGAVDGPGAVVASGWLLVNSGYARVGGMAGNVLLAFAPEE